MNASKQILLHSVYQMKNRRVTRLTEIGTAMENGQADLPPPAEE